MKIASKLKMALACIAFLSFAVSCDSDDDNPKPVDNTITGIAVKNSNLKILVQALTRAELAATLQGTGPFTVFAPTDAAFTAFLKTTPYATINDVPKDVLTQILLNHVVSGTAKSTDLQTGYIKTLAKGGASTTNTLSMYVCGLNFWSKIKRCCQSYNSRRNGFERCHTCSGCSNWFTNNCYTCYC